MRGAQPVAEGDLVFDHAVPGVGAGVAGAARAQPRAAVAAMVGRVDRMAAVDGSALKAVVAAHLLGGAVHPI